MEETRSSYITKWTSIITLWRWYIWDVCSCATNPIISYNYKNGLKYNNLSSKYYNLSSLIPFMHMFSLRCHLCSPTTFNTRPLTTPLDTNCNHRDPTQITYLSARTRVYDYFLLQKSVSLAAKNCHAIGYTFMLKYHSLIIYRCVYILENNRVDMQPNAEAAKIDWTPWNSAQAYFPETWNYGLRKKKGIGFFQDKRAKKSSKLPSLHGQLA